MSSIPEILTANTYFWRPAGTASGRRSNERWRQAEVERFIVDNKEALDDAGIVITFAYSETCNHVYKSVHITQHGKKVNISAVRKALGEYTPPTKPYTLAYKAVAVVDDRFFSIFDGKTEYVLGVEMQQKAQQFHNGGYYVYRTLEDAWEADVPSSSILYDQPRAVLEVKIGGKRVKYGKKVAVSTLTPVTVIYGGE